MSRFSSLLVGSLLVSQIVLPVAAHASSRESERESSRRVSRVSPIILPTNFFLPVTARPVVTPTPAPSPTNTPKPTTKYILPVIVTFKPVVTPSPVVTPTATSRSTPVASPTSTPFTQPTKEPVKEITLPQDKKDTIKRFYDSMYGKLDDLSSKLTNLAARMDARVAELKTKGVSTISIEKALDAAKAKIVLAKTNLADATIKADTLVESADRKAAFDDLKLAILGVQDNLKSAHELLTEAANQLKTAYQTLPAVKAN